MIGFIKWLIQQYNLYKLEQCLKPTDNQEVSLFIRNYEKCIEVGFTEAQIYALMNLLHKGN